MRCRKVYLDDVSECQGELFAYAADNGIDVAEFTEFYLKSDIRRMIDESKPRFCAMLGKEIFEALDVKGVKHAETEQNGFMAEWLGVFYSELQWALDISSSEVIERLPVKKAMRAYPGLHDLDMELAVKRIIKQI